MRVWLFPLLCAFMVVGAGCGSRVTTDFQADYDFSAVKTWAWKDPKTQKSDHARLDSPLLRERIEAVIAEELKTVPLQEAAADSASVLVRYLLESRTRLEDSGVSFGIGYSTGRSYLGTSSGTRVREYQDGTIIIDVFDRESGKHIWRGTNSRRLSSSSGDPEKQKQRVRDLVRAIVAKFPPGKE